MSTHRIAIAIAPDHPAFAGHFPGRPIVPGVLLLDLAQREIEASTGLRLQALATVKFLSPVLPGQPLTLAFEVDAGQVRFECLRDTQAVAKGRFITTGGEARA